jgi:hypothetical protein
VSALHSDTQRLVRIDAHTGREMKVLAEHPQSDVAELVLDTENPGDVLSFSTDPDFVIRAATAFNLKTAETTLRVRDEQTQPWRELVVWPFEQMGMYGQINGGTVDFLSFPDFRPLVMSNPGTHAVEAVAFEYLQYEWRVLDPAIRADFDVLQKAHPGHFFP